MLRGLRLLISVTWLAAISGGSCLLATADEPLRKQPAAASDPLDPAVVAAARQRWEGEIAKLEARDAAETDPENAILLIGSSSIRLWETLAAEMAPFPTIQRGYGGAKYSDVAVFAPRLLQPHRYRALVIFVANDVSGSPHDHSPEQVAGWLRSIVEVSQQHQPDAAIFVIEVTPSARRWEVWPETQAVNAALREVCLEQPGMTFIPTAPYYLDAAKQPRSELFRADRLHLNRDGYRLWAQLIQRRLRDFVTMPPAVRPAP